MPGKTSEGGRKEKLRGIHLIALINANLVESEVNYVHWSRA